MCDQRERLIEYVFDECDASSRREVDQHLETCQVCRDEIAGLRATRQDLLAWEVPEHGSVWRPFAPVRQPVSWRAVPVWAMAAAASVMLMIGAAGGVLAHAWVGEGRPATQAATNVLPTHELTPAEFAALEQHMLATVRSEMDTRMQRVSTGASDSHTLTDQELASRLGDVARDNQRMRDWLLTFHTDFQNNKHATDAWLQRVEVAANSQGGIK